MKNGQTTPLAAVVEKISMSLIDSFPHHPFYVLDDSEMIELIESIRKNGLITPIIVRPKGDRYELISGHRRKRAYEYLGHAEIGETNNYIIYGHNMKNGTMFSSLTKYKSQSYYDEHPVLYLYTPDGDYRIELIAGFVSKPTGEVYNTDQTYEQILKYCSQSTFRSTATPLDDEIYITLSTCSYEYENARYVVIGKLAKK